MRVRGGLGFTLVELLVVIVIIALLAALLIPVLVHVLCVMREGVTKATMQQLAGACETYAQDHGVFPPGDGTGSRDLVAALSRRGPRGLDYFDFKPGLVNGEGHFVNPVHADGEPEAAILYYRNNQGRRAAPAGQPPVMSRRFDFWAAGCGYRPGRADRLWGVKSWE
jgi:prepilin-type N-terminal cleavage/methylation domain-containing protein